MSIRDLGEDLACITQQGKLQEIPGICHDLSEVIDEYARTRKVRRYEQECKGIPQGLIDLMSIPGLGPKTLALLRNLISGQRNVHCVEAESHELDLPDQRCRCPQSRSSAARMLDR